MKLFTGKLLVLSGERKGVGIGSADISRLKILSIFTEFLPIADVNGVKSFILSSIGLQPPLL